ncbi:DNA-protecting protein DprA [Aliishimia ponticola]|uniref:DNA-protecting protein DprA n=1 Tax=Aliishimia ponticola TaxID=2499833 RepID=A0A4S4NF88_9RHOB|nr:DNA-processing protein DprA [Aliishimia ponticola]THH37247.1 DNA-protecting protein DprA [Aliishimia ponticola]
MAGESFSSSTHPPLPPTTEDIRFTSLRLLRSRRVGATTFHRLRAEHGSARDALAALPDVARAAGVSSYEICPEGVIAAELKAGARAGAVLLVHGFAGYPDALADLADAPPVLWALGRLDLLNKPMISLVGARNASSLGTRMAKALSRELGEEGHVVVSGLARGIDAAAHLAALPSGTIAVQAGGVDVIYPAENADLADRIAKDGLRLSEQPMGLQPMARHFPARNRIIAGLGRACVVVEAAAKSGSLITARDAADLGREVMAVPGHPFDARAAGCNMLIRDGATLIRRAADVIEALGPLAHPGLEKLAGGDPVRPLPAPTSARASGTAETIRTKPIATDIAKLHSQILDRLGPTPVPEDQLIRDLAATPASLSPALTELELSGEITRHSGGLLSRSN